MSEWILPGIYVTVGLVLLILASKMKKGTLKLNSVAGIRLESVMASEDTWKLVHMKAAPRFVILAIVCFDCTVLTAIPILFPDFIPTWVPLTIAIIQVIVGLVWITVHALRDAKKFNQSNENIK
jgi:hypothetical protein